MKLRDIFSRIYPALLVFPGHLIAVLLIFLDRFDWPELMAIAVTGIITGIIAEIIEIRSKADISEYIVKVMISIIAAAVFWFAADAVVHKICSDLWRWGWWLSERGTAVRNAVLFAPAVITSVFWAVYAKKAADKIIMILANPVVHITLWYYIIYTLLSCLPT